MDDECSEYTASASSESSGSPESIFEEALGSPLEDNSDWKADLAKSLDGIQHAGNFATDQQYQAFVNPGLRVNDVLISLPLDIARTDILKGAAKQAPFGKGTETLVDLSVHNTWELGPSEFQITNPDWPAFLEQMCSEMSTQLGLTNVSVKPHKLLLYEVGSFFRPHKDSEKAAGMVATLSICLPSVHQGGEIHLSHQGQHHVVDTSQSIFRMHAAAWYSDVLHEIKPVTQGHRLVLIYNIIHEQDTRIIPLPAIHDYLEQSMRVKQNIAKWTMGPLENTQLVYLLDHQYSESSLRFANLKGRDKAIYLALQDAIAGRLVHVFLANVTAGREEYPQEEGGGRYNDDGELYDDSPLGPGGVDLLKFKITYLGAEDGTCLTDADTNRKTEIYIRRGDLLNTARFNGRCADDVTGGAYLGNENAATEYKYHDSALVLVPYDGLPGFIHKQGHNSKRLLDMVNAQLDASMNDGIPTEAKKAFLSKALIATPELAPKITSLSWQIQERGLFTAAIIAQFKSGAPTRAITALLEPYPAPQLRSLMDWDVFLAHFLKTCTAAASFSDIQSSLETLRSHLLDPEVVASLEAWLSASAARRYWFELASELVLDDYDSVMALISQEWEDQEWIQDKLPSKLKGVGTPELSSKIALELLRRGHQESSLGIMPAVEQLLDRNNRRVLDCLALDWRHLKSDSSTSEKARAECHRFLDLVQQMSDLKLFPIINNLIERSLSKLKINSSSNKPSPTSQQAWADFFSTSEIVPDLLEGLLALVAKMAAADLEDDVSTLFQHNLSRLTLPAEQKSPCLLAWTNFLFANNIIDRLVDVLNTANVPPLEQIKAFFVHLLRTQTQTLPDRPLESKGWEYRKRCNIGCLRCKPLNQFLTSSEAQTTRFADLKSIIAEHLMDVLDSSSPSLGPMFEVSKTLQQPDRSGVAKYTVEVTKLSQGMEYKAELEMYEDRWKEVAKLQIPYLESLLGPDMYAELLLGQRPKRKFRDLVRGLPTA